MDSLKSRLDKKLYRYMKKKSIRAAANFFII